MHLHKNNTLSAFCWSADSAWLDTEQQQDVEPRSFQMRHKGHDMLGEPSCPSPRADAELDRLFVNRADAGSMRTLDQSARRHQHLYGDSTDMSLLRHQPTDQQADFLLEADDTLSAEAIGMKEYTISDLMLCPSSLSTMMQHTAMTATCMPCSVVVMMLLQSKQNHICLHKLVAILGWTRWSDSAGSSKL